MNTTSRFQTLLGKAVIYCIFIACGVVFLLFGIQHFGAKYAERAFLKQLEQSGLTPLVHYEKVHFDPFTLTPSFEQVRVGNPEAPWLHFARIAFNSYPLTHPNLDISFWVQESAIEEVSRDTGRLMRAAGIDTLLAKGTFSSQTEGQAVNTHFDLIIKDVGKVSLSSHINLLNDAINLPELRSDLLASIALGQPEAMLNLYGDDIELSSLSARYDEAGLVAHLLPAQPMSARATQAQKDAFAFGSQMLGLAPANSPEAKHIATTLTDFLADPQTIRLAVTPDTAVSLTQLARYASEGRLYQTSQMNLSVQAANPQ
ncbi:hypothetical protein J9B83_09305 [Marinomonas sp. A79]|uniref:DUF2125 domain-containing protein n=1 Tax=Marinomonas vulgaris TaxID=2823372 RepID=A0ABS5HBU5_9GAMM|nr:hypothetical protein [Marinomonas vulgaris]MBR7889137.1 hypothetical protein [Marinomonas vulgaris]